MGPGSVLVGKDACDIAVFFSRQSQVVSWVVAQARLTIAIFVLKAKTCQPRVPKSGRGVLTKREKASLNSETCSSVSESACIMNTISVLLILGPRLGETPIAGSGEREEGCSIPCRL